jgi:hypothetical protein
MKKPILLFCFIIVFSSAAQAAPFCLGGLGIQPQCIYYEVTQCIKATEPPNTSCKVSPDATLSYFGGGNYCVVTSELMAQCLYADRDQCSSEAARANGLCIDRRSMDDDRDPYRYDPRIQN